MRDHNLRPDVLPVPLPTVIKANELELCIQAEQTYLLAEYEAKRWTDAGRQAFRSAKKEGWQEGYDDGLATAKAALTDIAAELTGRLEQIENDAQILAMEIARKLVSSLPAQDIVSGIVEAALTAYRDEKSITVVMSARASDEEKTRVQSVIQSSKIPAVLEFDSAVHPDGCELRLSSGFVDLSIDRQFEKLAAVLMAEVGDE
ncbi:FliH/SctL family protein [Pseudaestuariivita rosea]|uniref:FliH/SctL family protein n=1 Tax=Pseudaestuariivita rosea TaxID=2763263 RepID=UPI001ABBCD72|nr:FliH/SctL family protein [Pseudaestuariivita rosea]